MTIYLPKLGGRAGRETRRGSLSLYVVRLFIVESCKAISAEAQVIHSFSSHGFQNQLAVPSSGTSSISIFPGVLVSSTINLGPLPSTLWFISLVLPWRAWRVLFWLRSCNSGCADVSSLLALVRSLQACLNTSLPRDSVFGLLSKPSLFFFILKFPILF